jgi:hypothetical protein
MRVHGLLFLLVGASFAQSPYREVKASGVVLRYNSDYFSEHSVKQEPKLSMAEVGTDIPIGVAPAHTVISLKDKRPLPALDHGPRYFSPAISAVAIIPLKDASVKSFAQAYPEVSKNAAALRGLLARRPPTFPEQASLPDLNSVDISQAFHTRVRYLDFPLFSGVAYLTAYTQESEDDPVNNEQLTLVVEGLTKDGRYYIDARFAITHPSLPKGIDATKAMKGVARKAHLRAKAKDLEAAADESFWPPMASFRELLGSLSVQ